MGPLRSAILAAVLALGAAPVRAQSDTSPPPHEATSYDITLVTSDTGAHLLGEVQTGWRLRTVQPVEMQLDTTFRVIRVLVDGKPNTRLSRTMYARPGAEVVVPHEKAPGDTLTTRVRYHGIPSGGFRVGADRTGARALAGETAGDRGRLWLPMPEGSAGRATVTWHVQAATGQRVIANGTLDRIDTLAYGHTTWHFHSDVPIPLQAMAVAAGRYAVTTQPPGCAGCAPVELWTAPGDSAAAAAGPLGRAGETMAFLVQRLGPFPYRRMAFVASLLAPEGRAAAGLALLDEARVHGGSIEGGEIARALAAQWFGNAVDEAGPADAQPSPAVAAYLAYLWGRRQRPGPASAMLTRSVASIESLHRTVGDSAFFRGLRGYLESHRNATAAPGDLGAAMREASGRRLDWQFGQGTASNR